MFDTIAEIADPSAARVLILALKAHGFHPLEGGDSGPALVPGASPTPHTARPHRPDRIDLRPF